MAEFICPLQARVLFVLLIVIFSIIAVSIAAWLRYMKKNCKEIIWEAVGAFFFFGVFALIVVVMCAAALAEVYAKGWGC